MSTQETRKLNQAARAALYHEQAETIRTARQALRRVMEGEAVTPEQLLRAAELLTALSGIRRY